jgi:hypothetical protein
MVIYWVIESDGEGNPSSVVEYFLPYFLEPPDIIVETEVVLVGLALHLAHQVLLFLTEVLQQLQQLLRTSLKL